MSIKISGYYVGQKRVKLVHPSGAEITTSAPKDNQGDGLLFSPTDLVASGLASCMVTIMALAAEKKGYDISGTWVEVEKEMASDLPRRIVSLPVVFHLPRALSPEAREVLEVAAKGCPVHHSLGAGVKSLLTFNYDVA